MKDDANWCKKTKTHCQSENLQQLCFSERSLLTARHQKKLSSHLPHNFGRMCLKNLALQSHCVPNLFQFHQTSFPCFLKGEKSRVTRSDV